MNKMNVLAVMKGIFVKHKNKTLAIVAGVLVAGIVSAQSIPVGVSPHASTIINCSVAESCNIVVAAPEVTVASVPSTGIFGANSDEISRWISGNFTDDLDVDDDLNVDGDLTITGTYTQTGTSTFGGYVSSTAVVREAYGAYTGSASSQTLCAIRNTGATNRVLDAATLVYATSTATGGVNRFTISLSATQGATGTGANLLFDSAFESPTNGIENITTTSTLRSASTSTGALVDGIPVLWQKGVWLNFLIASPTTTVKGDCRAMYY